MITYAFTFARGGSKGIPGKNIRPLAGIPLLAHAIKAAEQVTEIQRHFVSTDSPAIAAVAQEYGATVIDRPAELAQDTSPEFMAWKHAVGWVQEQFGVFDRFISLPATAPLRMPEDITRCLTALNVNTDVVITMTPAQRSPWFNMVRADEDGRVSILVQGDQRYVRRQDAPQAYDMTTLAYVMRPDFIVRHEQIWDGRIRGVVVSQQCAIDIDTELDFKIADFLMGERIQQEQKLC